MQVGILVEHLATGKQPVADVVASLRQAYPDRSRILLIVDQVEELYTGRLEEGLRSSFIEALLALSAQGIQLVLTLRADYYGHALNDPRLGRVVGAGLVNVLPMVEEE